MPVQIDLVGLFIAIILVIVAIVLVPMMIQVKKTSEHLDDFLRDARRDLLPMLREMREASERLNRTALKVEEGVVKAGTLVDSLEEVGESIHSVNSFLHHDIGRYAGNLAGLWLGFRSASKVFMKQILKQQKGG